MIFDEINPSLLCNGFPTPKEKTLPFVKSVDTMKSNLPGRGVCIAVNDACIFGALKAVEDKSSTRGND